MSMSKWIFTNFKRVYMPGCTCIRSLSSGAGPQSPKGGKSKGKSPSQPPSQPPKPTSGSQPPKSDGTTYMVPEYYSYNDHSFYEMENAMEKYRIPQPSSVEKKS